MGLRGPYTTWGLLHLKRIMADQVTLDFQLEGTPGGCLLFSNGVTYKRTTRSLHSKKREDQPVLPLLLIDFHLMIIHQTGACF